jgi:Flp pilus assembly protein TadB
MNAAVFLGFTSGFALIALACAVWAQRSCSRTQRLERVVLDAIEQPEKEELLNALIELAALYAAKCQPGSQIPELRPVAVVISKATGITASRAAAMCLAPKGPIDTQGGSHE